MGGMFAGYYALAHPESIKSLVFMSSVGITRTPEWARVENVMKNIENSRLATYGANFAESMMRESPFTPFDMYRIGGPIFGRKGIKNGMRRRLEEGVLSDV